MTEQKHSLTQYSKVYNKSNKTMTNTTQTHSNYYRITAYHPTHDFTIIIDSNGMFEKLWQFSSFLIQKGFKIIEVGDSTTFEDGNIEKASYTPNKIILRAIQKGKPKYTDNIIQVGNNKYNII